MLSSSTLNKKGVQKMSNPTYQDASLIIQMMQLSSTMDTANSWIHSEKFIPDYRDFISKYPQGSDEYGYVAKVCGWFETLGTFYKHKLINEELLFDWLAVNFMWEKLKGFALGVREESNFPRFYENFEAMAKVQEE